ncbi:hypothetical protein L8V80_01415 [Campylobacter lari]|nr:hypothetical protein [Campylobacter lari]
MMSKKTILKDFLAYEKLLYIKFANPISEDEILKKSFEELGLKDDFSYKLKYFQDKSFTHVFLCKYEDILDIDYIIPEPLLFEVYFKNNTNSENLVLLFKEKYIVLVEYLGCDFQNCKVIPLNVYDKIYEEKLKNTYKHIISIDDTQNLSSFDKFNSNIFYQKLLKKCDQVKINFTNKEKINHLKSFSFKILLAFVCGVLLALAYPLYLYAQKSFYENEKTKYENLIKKQDDILEQVKINQKQNQEFKKLQEENELKVDLLQKFYANTLCYKDFYDFLRVLNSHQACIEALHVKNNDFIIELKNDYEFYEDFKKHHFVLKNKEVNNGKITLFLKNLYKNLENIFAKLSEREFALALIVAFVFGFFMVYMGVFDYFEKQMRLSKDELYVLQTKYEQKQEMISDLKEDENISYNEQSFLSLDKDYQSILKDIEGNLSKVRSLQIQSYKNQDEYFAYYELRLSFVGDFIFLMQFLQKLDPYIKVKNLELVKYENKLKITLNLIFALV